MVKVYLSPSAQEHNTGSNNYGTEEYRMNQISDIVEKILKQHEINVYRNIPTMSLKEIVKDSNNKKPDIHFAIHSNAFNGKARGCEVFCHKFNSKGHELAKKIYKYLSPLTPTNDRGIKQGFNFYGIGKHMYELAYTAAPASLIEIAFHDNPEDAAWIINNIEPIAISLAKAILDYFNIQYMNSRESNNDLFPVTAKAISILKKASKYSDIWIDFLNEHKNINLSGLIEKIYEMK